MAADKASLARDAFLFCLARTANRTISAEFAGISRAAITKMIASDHEFAMAVEQAVIEAHERIFYEAMQRGLIGKPIWHRPLVSHGKMKLGHSVLSRFVLCVLCHLCRRMWQRGLQYFP